MDLALISIPIYSNLFSGVSNVGESLRHNILDAADSVTGTGKFRHDPAQPPVGRAQLPAHPAEESTRSHYKPSREESYDGSSVNPYEPREQDHAGANSISTTSGPSAGIGSSGVDIGGNATRGSSITDGEAANVAAAQRGHATTERDHTNTGVGSHAGAGGGLPAGAQSTGPAIAGAAPAGPGMVGGAMI
jgi:hypothetical protein